MKSATALEIFCTVWCLLKELESPSVELEYGWNHIKKTVYEVAKRNA